MIRLHGEMMRWDNVGVLSAEDTERLLRPILPPRYAQQFEQTNDTDFAMRSPNWPASAPTSSWTGRAWAGSSA